MLAPDDIQKKMFSLGRKLENTDVGIFVKEVQINYQLIYDKVNEQEKQIKGMEKKLKYYRDVESSLQDALVHAEKVSEQKITESVEEAQRIEDAAHKKAEDIIADAKSELVYLKSIIKEFEDVYDQYQDKYKDFIQGQLKFIEDSKKFMADEKLNVKKFVSNIDVEDYSPTKHKKNDDIEENDTLEVEEQSDIFDSSDNQEELTDNFSEDNDLGKSNQDFGVEEDEFDEKKEESKNYSEELDSKFGNFAESLMGGKGYSSKNDSTEDINTEFDDAELKNNDLHSNKLDISDMDATNIGANDIVAEKLNADNIAADKLNTYNPNINDLSIETSNEKVEDIDDNNDYSDEEVISSNKNEEEVNIEPSPMKEEFMDSNPIDDLFTLPEIDIDSLDFSTLNFSSTQASGGVDFNATQQSGGVDFNATQASEGVEFNATQQNSGVEFNTTRASGGVDFNSTQSIEDADFTDSLNKEENNINKEENDERVPDLSLNANVELKYANDSFFGKKKKVDNKQKVLEGLDLGTNKAEEKAKIRQMENSYAQELLKANRQVATGVIEPEDTDENNVSSERNYGPANFNSENRGLASKPLNQGSQEPQRRSLFSFNNGNNL